MRPGTQCRARGRSGFTLVELLIAVILFTIVGGAIIRVVTRQQRFYQGVGEVMDQRSQLRQATSVLPVDLRSLSSIGGDILTFSDSAVDIRAHIGSGIICNIDPLGPYVDLPPLSLASRQTLTSFSTTPIAGDVIFLYDEGAVAGNFDDSWVQRNIDSYATNSGTCMGAPYTDPSGDASRPRHRITVTGAPLPATVVAGGAVRLARRVRYSLYQAADAQWYLGYSQWQGGAFTAPQAVSGPYRAYATGTGAASGLSFKFYAENGTAIVDPALSAQVARVDVVVRGRTRGTIHVDGMATGQYADSLATKVAIRNRS